MARVLVTTKDIVKLVRLSRKYVESPAPRVTVTGRVAWRHADQDHVIDVRIEVWGRAADQAFVLFSGLPASTIAWALPSCPTVTLGWALSDPGIALCSCVSGTQYHGQAVQFSAGSNFLVRAQLGANLRALSGMAGPLAMAGPLQLAGHGLSPEVELKSAFFSYRLGPIHLANAYISVRSRYHDGTGPLPADMDDGALGRHAVEPPYPPGNALVTEVGMGGVVPLPNFRSFDLWTMIPHDDALLVFDVVRDASPLAAFIGRVGGLLVVDNPGIFDAWLGGNDWLGHFPDGQMLAQAAPYLLTGFNVQLDLPSRVITCVTLRLTSRHPLALPGLEGVGIRDPTVAWAVAFPGGGGTRSILVAADGQLDVEGNVLDMAMEIPSLTIFAHAHGGDVDPRTLARTRLLSHLQWQETGQRGANYPDAFLELAIHRGQYQLRDVAFTNDDGDELVPI